ncbi:MAG: DUF2157 domain-containing protein [Akkermansia sp.]|nr:DUF2157 domain-containing protein [Akkermansia sp.]
MKRKEIEQLEAAGIISAEQASAIAEHFHLNGTTGRQWLVWSMSSLAGVLILGGIIMLISANWEAIPDGVKMVVAMALLLGAWVACANIHRTYPLVAEGLGLIGGGMWLACIALYGQIFQLQNPLAEGCLLFFAGVCVLPFLMKQRLLMLGVAITSVVLLCALLDNAESWLTLRPWVNNSEEVASALALLFLAWWVFAEHCRGAQSFLREYRWLSIPALLAYLILLQIPLLYGEVGFAESRMQLGLTLAGPLMLLVAKPRSITWGQWLCVVAMLGLALPLGQLLSEIGEGMEPIGIAVGLLLGGGLMAIGHRALRLEWLNFGTFMILSAGIALVANVLDSLTQSGLVLIVAGCILLGLVLSLERQRRKLAQAIREKSCR